VFINNRAAVRKGDPTQHCGGVGKMVECHHRRLGVIWRQAGRRVVDGDGTTERRRWRRPGGSERRKRELAIIELAIVGPRNHEQPAERGEHKER